MDISHGKTITVWRFKKFYELFQNQERVFDLDLGWDFWKFRPSDASTGRFLMPDPLGSEYAHNSLYAFQENKLGRGVELEGAELISFPLSSTSAIARPLTIPNSSALRIPLIPNGSTLIPMNPTENHHLIPNQLKDNPVVQEAREGGFKQDGKENKMPLEKYNKNSEEGRHGNHPKYTNNLRDKLNDFARRNPERSIEQSTEFVRNTAQKTKEIINSKPQTKINDLFNQNLMTMPSDNTRTKTNIDKTKVNPCLGNSNCL